MTGPLWGAKSLESLRASSILAALFIFSGCTSVPVKSLCIVDFVSQKCWVNKQANEGRSFKELADQQIQCHVSPNVPCIYMIDSLDLTNIVDSL